ncbi:MAG: hypothetical protein QOE33_2686 [Acidobacteriota bacterium]|nr:hypothetical protein [Acidobacteriota bacterium]
MRSEYETAQITLAQLKREQIELSSMLMAAANEGDAAELTRLQKRKLDIPSEIKTAEILSQRARVTELKEQVASAQNRLSAARTKSKTTDERTVATLSVLDEERKRINYEALADLSAVYEAQKVLGRLAAELREAEATLYTLFSEAA